MAQDERVARAREQFEEERFVGQEGSRWINRRPTGEEIARWFTDNVRLHEGMAPDPYVPGIVIIPSSEKVEKPVLFDEQASGGRTFTKVRRETVGVNEIFVPYAKVETRIAYFWDLCAHMGWVGEIEPIQAREPMIPSLPAGFTLYGPKGEDGKQTWFIVCSYRVSVWAKRDDGSRGDLVMMPPAGTKIVPIASRYNVDENAVMKAETGAIGRALGMAGMLALPGSGVATAEDMQEALSTPAAAPTGEPEVEAQVPAVQGAPGNSPTATLPEASSDSLKAQAEQLLERLKEHPKQLEEVQAWARQRKLNLGQLEEGSSALKGVVRQLEKQLGEATSAGE